MRNQLTYWLNNLPAYWDVVSSFATRVVAFLAVILMIMTPFQTYLWSRIPYPGFLLEPTQVISDFGGGSLGSRVAGTRFPRVVSLDGQRIDRRSEYFEVLSQNQIGESVQMMIEYPDGTSWLFPEVPLSRFPTRLLLAYFWLPYLIGIIYLITGLWVARKSRGVRPARAFAYLCAILAGVIGLLFSVYFSLPISYLWTIAMAETGATLIAVGLLFPEEIGSPHRNTRLRMLAHLFGLSLAAWGILSLRNPADPWAYIRPWRYSYIYAAFGILFFFGSMIYRRFVHHSRVTRQQVRIILLGSLLAFAPVAIWLGAPLFGIYLRWNPVLFLPFLLFFPILFAFAILYYHLWDIDLILRRTLVYGALTATLLLIFVISIVLLQLFFSYMTGQTSELAIVISTLAIAALFAPLRHRIQNDIDRVFYRKKYDAQKVLEAFSLTIRDEVELEHLEQHILEVLQETLQPEHASLWLAPSQKGSKVDSKRLPSL